MISISEMKAKVKALVEDITGQKAYFDIVPNNVKTASLITRQATEFSGRTIDGDAHDVRHGFEIFIFSFVSADTCDAPVMPLRTGWWLPLTANTRRISGSSW